MGATAKRLLFAVLFLAMASAPYALNYMYFSDTELTVFNGRIRSWHLDTLGGPIRTNDMFMMMTGVPSAPCEYVIQSSDSVWWDSTYGHECWQYVHGAPPLPWPDNAQWHREQAIAQGHYFDEGDTMRARVRLFGDWLRVWFAGFNQPFDSVDFVDHFIEDSAIVWFEAPLSVWGVVTTNLILCSSADVGLEDNIRYGSSDPVRGEIVPGHEEKFALIAEGSIVVLNTWANGRENSGGDGNNQPDPDSTDIALNGLYYSLHGSFTFAQQNDPDSGYVCTCMPDDRGVIYLWGSIGQQQRGYVHRSTRQSTGYLKGYRYDPDLKFWNTGLFANVVENEIVPASLEFDTITVGEFAFASTQFTNEFVPLRLTELSTTTPFAADDSVFDEAWTHELQVIFLPQAPGEYNGTLSFRSDYYNRTFTVPLHGVAVGLGAESPGSPLPDRLTLGVYPNPFNCMATISFGLPEAGVVKLVLFDLLGREVRTLANSAYHAGEHKLSVNGAGLESGLYFARLELAESSITEKLLLIK
ncbi:T9SS type A sorting domain-containing protein [candidate division KSB1 bacterium]|nr:T9SS type A sorting domain-containing protein [candidate division KSB1 bacterium]